MASSTSQTPETLTWSGRILREISGIQALPFRIFRFFASIQLAIIVILSLMAVFTAGTLVESYHGMEAASILVYQSGWFSLVLFLLGMNVMASAIDRIPWKKKHIGFLMTHLGIITILVGSFITKAYMVDGQMPIAEGETEHRITLPEPVLYVLDAERRREWAIPLPRKAFPWNGEETLSAANFEGVPFQIILTRSFPKGILREEIVPAEGGTPAVKVRLFNSFVDQPQWLIQSHPQYGAAQIGPARLRFTDTFLKETAPETMPALGYLEFEFPDTSIRIPLEKDLTEPAEFALEGTPYKVRVLRNFRDAAIVGNQLTEQHEGGQEEGKVGRNPAVVLMLEGEGLSERHTVFANFPDFPTVHGMKPSAAGVRIFYRLPGGGLRSESHELRFVYSDEKLSYQIQDGLKVTGGEVKPGEEVSLGWMDLQFRLEEFYPHAALKKSFTATENTSERLDAFPAIQVTLAGQNEEKSLWLGQGMPERIDFAGKKYNLLYGQKKIPAGFKLTLEDFRIEHYPGTRNPASFESDVILRDDFQGIEKKVNISMNEPLDHNGFRVFQASYSLQEGSPDISIFSVVRDPGIPVKYGGVIIMVSGILTMFFSGRFNFRTKNQDIEIK